MKFKPLKRPKIRIRRPRIRIRWRKRTSRRVIGAAILFFLSLFALQLVLLNYTKSILQNALNLQLQEATNGRYVSSFEKIEISYTKRNLFIHNLRLFPTEDFLNDSVGAPFSYDIFVPKVEIVGLNLRKAYLEGILEVSSLRVQQPKVQLSANFDRGGNENSLSLFSQDLYENLPQAVKKLTIGTISLLDGSLELKVQRNQKKSVLELPVFNLELMDFRLEKESEEEAGKVFYSDSFFFETENVKGLLADKLYSFQLQSLKISSKDSTALANNLILLPLQEAAEIAENGNADILYRTEIPQVYLYGLSFPALFHSGALTASEVSILNPSFSLLTMHPFSPVQPDNVRPENLYAAIEKVLKSIEIRELYLRNGEVEISEWENEVRQKMQTKIQLAQISNFSLDSVAHLKKDKLLYAQEIGLDLREFSLRLSDDFHLLEANELHLSSENKNIRATDFRILPDPESSRINEEIPNYYASAPEIFLGGVNLQKAVNHQKLNIDSLLLQKPSFSISPVAEALPAEQLQEEGFHEEDLYGLIKDYLLSLNIKRIAMLDGEVNIKQPEQPASAAFLLNISRAGFWNFRLDSASAYQLNKLFFADDFELEIENYEHELPDDIHTISAGRVAISTLSDQIHIEDVFIRPEGLDFPFTTLPALDARTLLNLHVPELRLFGADILKAYLYKELEVDKVIIPFPVLRLGTSLKQEGKRADLIQSSALYDLIKPRLEVIKVDELELQEGNVNMAFHDPEGGILQLGSQQVSVQMDNFLFDSLTASSPQHLFYSEEFEIQVKDYEAQFSDRIHILRAENLKASTLRKEISAENVSINTSQNDFTDEELLVNFRKDDFIKIELPRLRINGLDFHKAYREEAIHIDSVLAVNPTVVYTYLPDLNNNLERSDIKLEESGIYQDMAPYLDGLFINTVFMEDGSFFARQQKKNTRTENVAIEDVSLLLHQFRIDSSALVDTAPFLYSDNLKLKVGSYRHMLIDLQHTLSAEQIFLSTEEQKVEAHSIRIIPSPAPSLAEKDLKPSSKEKIFLELPHLQLLGVHFDSLFRNERLYTESLLLENPYIRLEKQNANDLEEDKAQEFNPATLLSEELKSVHVKEVIVNDGKLSFFSYGNEKPLKLNADQFQGLVENFHLHNREAHPLFYADNIQFSVQNFERKLADSLHLLSVDEIEFSTGEESLTARGIVVSPRIMADLQEQMIETETSGLYNIKVPLAKINGVKADQLQEDSLLLREIVFHKPEIELILFPELKQLNSSPPLQEKPWHHDLLRYYELLQIKKGSVKEGAVTFTTVKQGEKESFRVNNVSILAENIQLDSMAPLQPDRVLFSDFVELEIEDYNTRFSQDFYELQLKELSWNSRDKDLVIDSIRISPLPDRDTFAERKGYETDQYTFRNRKFELQNFQLDLLLKEGKFAADSLLLDGLYLYIYRDKRQPYPENRSPAMPQTSIRNMEFPFFIRGVAVRNGYIGYAERVKGTRESGFIDLTELLVLSDTISNYPRLLENGLTTNLYMNAQLMGKGDLSAYFEIPLNDSLNRHTYYGRLGAMELSAFNPILEKTVFVKIKSGYAEQIDFYVEADRNMANGSMEFLYNDLQLALVNKKTGKTGGPVKQLASLVANAFFVDSENIAAKDEPVRKGEISFEREKDHSTVNYWIKTLVNGFKSSIGL